MVQRRDRESDRDEEIVRERERERVTQNVDDSKVLAQLKSIGTTNRL